MIQYVRTKVWGVRLLAAVFIAAVSATWVLLVYIGLIWAIGIETTADRLESSFAAGYWFHLGVWAAIFNLFGEF